MARFDLLAAIDLRGGRVVRLREGDFDRETVYADDPGSVAAGLLGRGVRWLHVVDLDGARAGERRQQAAVAAILQAVAGGAEVEVAGGLRDAATVAAVLEAGASRAVIGSAALADPALVARLVAEHGPDRVVVALDVRDGQALGQAWRAGAAGVPLATALGRLRDAGAAWFEVTSIARDGSLAGPDLELLRQAIDLAAGAGVIASGGVASVEDMLATWAIGSVGAIVGRGLYEGTFDLERGLRATGSA